MEKNIKPSKSLDTSSSKTKTPWAQAHRMTRSQHKVTVHHPKGGKK
jgi:hypothetical protein